MPPVQQVATAPALGAAATQAAPPARPGPQLVREPAVAPPGAPSQKAAQASLFGPMEVVAPVRGHGREPVPQASARRRHDRGLQTNFDFADGPRTLQTAVEATVYCNAPVALARERLVAGTIDWLIPCCGFALFVTAAQFTGAPLSIDRNSGPLLAAAALLIVFFYRVVCCIGNMDTPGLQWSGLVLLNFDGFRPGRKARLFRMAGGLVSALSAGIGLFWSLLDEERLTWHDYMSGTFPTQRHGD
jgi:uncharacterized RDD family membrane protein YckC